MALKTTAERITAYLKLRDAKEAAEKAFKDSMVRINEAVEKLEGELLNDLNNAGTDSVAVKGVGTAFRKERYSASVKDEAAFLDFIREHELPQLLDPRVNKTELRKYMDTAGETVPGVNISIDNTISVRRS